MIFVRKIDEQGYFICDDFVEEITEFTIETPCPQGFYKPKWNFETKEWAEGATQEEINALNIPVFDEETIAQQELYTAIESATTIAGLKSALLGGIDKSRAKVKAIK